MHGNSQNDPEIGADGKRYQLSAKREKFAQAVAAGSTLVDAREEAGFSQVTTRESQYVHATRLAQDDKVNLRVQELKRSAQAQADVTIGEIISALRLAIDMSGDERTPGNATALANAAHKLAQITGLDAPTRIAPVMPDGSPLTQIERVIVAPSAPLRLVDRASGSDTDS